MLLVHSSAAISVTVAGCDVTTTGSFHEWPVAGDDSGLLVGHTFGPRILRGDYDFHPGLDIPAEYGQPVHVFAPGVVQVAGDDGDYSSDTVVVDHCMDEPAPADMDDCEDFYRTQYAHLSEIEVESGDVLGEGAVIGRAGEGRSGLAHLHFEIREGGKSKAHAVHPLRFLPYDDLGPPSVTIDDVQESGPDSVDATVSVAVSGAELDVSRVELEVRSSRGDTLSSRVFDYEEWIREYSDSIDRRAQGGITVEPVDFDWGEPEKVVRFQFNDMSRGLALGEIEVTARVVDVSGYSARAEARF